MRNLLIVLLTLLYTSVAEAQHADFSKMSPMLRQITLDYQGKAHRAPIHDNSEVCAFVRLNKEEEGHDILKSYGCRSLAQFGQIHIASIPIGSLASLSLDPAVNRIEARQGNTVHMDTTTVLMGGAKAHEGLSPLPQAFTGKGVVVGVQDIGFDLTHPNFYNNTLTDYRIRRFWDFLSTDTIGSELYVGADYTTEEAIKNYAHSRDGLIIPHGTHTLGSAAGSGYNSPYRGMAPGSDICLVSNAVSDDVPLIDQADLYKYTYATDALGFKYIFDYAASRGMPCVISFSEGSPMDFRGDDVLYYEVLDSLTGPGRILVASAGNAGQQVTHIRKPAEINQTNIALLSDGKSVYFSVKGHTDHYSLLLHMNGPEGASAERTLTIPDLYALSDTTFTDTLSVGEKPYYITATCYPSCFNSNENVMEVVLKTDTTLGLDYYVGMEVEGPGCEVEIFRGAGYIVPSEKTFGDNAYSIHSPSSAPSVISVGATGYRTGFTNYLGQYRSYDMGSHGERSDYSSVGPTYDERVKPDVMAPGTNVISSYSSYYLEAKPDARDILSDVEHFDFQGRTYAWNANSGTSMSTPVVAGAIALWLEAKPDLSPSDVLEIIKQTSRHYDPNLEYPNNLYGYGEIDAYAGLLHVLGLSDVMGLSLYQPSSLTFSLSDDGKLKLTSEETNNRTVNVSIYTTAGSLIKSFRKTLTSGTTYIDLSQLPRGIYAIQVKGSDARDTGSTLIRW